MYTITMPIAITKVEFLQSLENRQTDNLQKSARDVKIKGIRYQE